MVDIKPIKWFEKPKYILLTRIIQNDKIIKIKIKVFFKFNSINKIYKSDIHFFKHNILLKIIFEI